MIYQTFCTKETNLSIPFRYRYHNSFSSYGWLSDFIVYKKLLSLDLWWFKIAEGGRVMYQIMRLDETNLTVPFSSRYLNWYSRNRWFNDFVACFELCPLFSMCDCFSSAIRPDIHLFVLKLIKRLNSIEFDNIYLQQST